MKTILRFVGDIARKAIAIFFAAFLFVVGASIWKATANYTATQGAGTIFRR